MRLSVGSDDELTRANKLLAKVVGGDMWAGRDAVSAMAKRMWSVNARLILLRMNMLCREKSPSHGMSVESFLRAVVAWGACFSYCTGSQIRIKCVPSALVFWRMALVCRGFACCAIFLLVVHPNADDDS